MPLGGVSAPPARPGGRHGVTARGGLRSGVLMGGVVRDGRVVLAEAIAQQRAEIAEVAQELQRLTAEYGPGAEGAAGVLARGAAEAGIALGELVMIRPRASLLETYRTARRLRQALQLGGHAPGYSQNRDARGRWAPGLSQSQGRQGEHEAAGAGGLVRGPAGEVHARAGGPGGGGGGGAGASAGGGGGSSASPSPTQLRAEIAHLRQRDAQLALRRQDLKDRNDYIMRVARRLDPNDPAQRARGQQLMQEYNENADRLAHIGRIHQRITSQVAARRAILFPNAGASREDEHGMPMPFSRDEFEQAMRPATARPISANNINMAFFVTIHGVEYFAKESSGAQGRYDEYAQARNEAATVAAMKALGDGDLAPAECWHIEASNGSSWTIQTKVEGRDALNYLPLGAAQHVTEDQLARAYLDQYVLGMQDRHAGNLFIDEQGHTLKEIDHGFGFKHDRTLEHRDTARDIWRAKVRAAGGPRTREPVVPKALIERVFNHQADLWAALDRYNLSDLDKRWISDRLFHLSLFYHRGSQSLAVFKNLVGDSGHNAFTA